MTLHLGIVAKRHIYLIYCCAFWYYIMFLYHATHIFCKCIPPSRLISSKSHFAIDCICSGVVVMGKISEYAVCKQGLFLL